MLVAWEVSSRLGITPKTVPSATRVIRELPHLLTTRDAWTAIAETLKSALFGLAVALAVAVPVGAVIGLVPWLDRSTRVVFEFLKPIPVVALLPLALLVFGVTLEMKVLLVAFGTTWPLLIQVVYGVRTVDPVASATARAFHIRSWRRLFGVTLPAASPYLASGLRVAGVSALLLGVVTELVGGAPGIGSEMRRSLNAAQFPQLYVWVVVAGQLGVCINVFLAAGERRALRWHTSVRRER